MWNWIENWIENCVENYIEDWSLNYLLYCYTILYNIILRLAPRCPHPTHIKDVVSEALMGVVLGSGNWSRDSRGARGSSAEEPDID